MKNAELLVSSGQSINTATTYQKERAAHGGLAALNKHYSFSLTSRFTMKQPNHKRTIVERPAFGLCRTAVTLTHGGKVRYPSHLHYLARLAWLLGAVFHHHRASIISLGVGG